MSTDNRKPNPSDVSDDEWALVPPHLALARPAWRSSTTSRASTTRRRRASGQQPRRARPHTPRPAQAAVRPPRPRPAPPEPPPRRPQTRPPLPRIPRSERVGGWAGVSPAVVAILRGRGARSAAPGRAMPGLPPNRRAAPRAGVGWGAGGGQLRPAALTVARRRRARSWKLPNRPGDRQRAARGT